VSRIRHRQSPAGYHVIPRAVAISPPVARAFLPRNQQAPCQDSPPPAILNRDARRRLECQHRSCATSGLPGIFGGTSASDQERRGGWQQDHPRLASVGDTPFAVTCLWSRQCRPTRCTSIGLCVQPDALVSSGFRARRLQGRWAEPHPIGGSPWAPWITCDGRAWDREYRADHLARD
jgi:hypothetical protein